MSQDISLGMLDTVINMYKERLYEISNELQEIQPKRDGTVLLRLNECSKNCGGCPHPKWELWKGHFRENQKPLWVAHQKKRPLACLRVNDKNEAYIDDVYGLISEAQEVIKRLSRVQKARADIINILKVQRKDLADFRERKLS